MTRTARRALVATAVAATLGTTLAACGSTPQATPERPTVTVTSTATAPDSPTPSGDDTTAAGGTVGDAGGSDTSGASSQRCASDVGYQAAAARDGKRITPSSDATAWTPYGSGGTWCPGLSWVEVQGYSKGAPVRPRQLLVYHDGYFQGTGIKCEARWGQEVVDTSSDAITVTYRFPDMSIPEQSRKQDPLGRATVSFRWNGSHVVMDGSLPYAFTEGKC